MPRSRARWRTAGGEDLEPWHRCTSGSGLGAALGAGVAFGSGATAITGIASSCSLVGWFCAVGQRLLDRRRFFLGSRSAALSFNLDQHRTDGDLVADFAGQLLDHAGDRRFHLDRRLVGHHVGELLVFLDLVADLDVPGDDLGLGNAFANVGELELIETHYASMTFLRAFFMRIGPGK